MDEHIETPLVTRKYRPSFDIVRMICMVLIIMMEFGLYFIPYYSYAEIFFNFAVGTLFTIYGYLVLRDGADLKKNIKSSLIAFIIMAVVYGLLTAGYYYILTGNPFAGISLRGLFNFLVLNYWGTNFCASIWYVQSTLYALVILWLLRKFKKYDWLLCIICFVIAILLGELAHVIHFSVLGYTYIPGNFLTRTIPYMLLGRLVHNYYDKIRKITHYLHPLILFLGGLLLSGAEFVILYGTDNLYYPNHFIGFIVMASSLCMYCVHNPDGAQLKFMGKYASLIYKGMYYVYNPLGYILLIVASIFCKTQSQYVFCQYIVCIPVIVITIGLFWLVAFLKGKFKSYDKDPEEVENES